MRNELKRLISQLPPHSYDLSDETKCAKAMCFIRYSIAVTSYKPKKNEGNWVNHVIYDMLGVDDMLLQKVNRLWFTRGHLLRVLRAFSNDVSIPKSKIGDQRALRNFFKAYSVIAKRMGFDSSSSKLISYAKQYGIPEEKIVDAIIRVRLAKQQAEENAYAMEQEKLEKEIEGMLSFIDKDENQKSENPNINNDFRENK